MNKLSLSIAIFFSTFFSPCLFSANPLVNRDEQKEDPHPIQPNNQTQPPKQVYDYTILHHKNVNHTLDDIKDVEDDLRDYVLAVNQKLETTNNQSPPLILGAVLQHRQTHKQYRYLIANTGLLSRATQPEAVKRAHKKGFHLIQATPGHAILQLLEWLQISKYYSVIALHTNKPVCRNCYLIAHSLWEKKLSTNEKGCVGVTFLLLDKMPNLAQQYINTHLNFSLVKNLVVPMMGYISKEETNKAIQQQNGQLIKKDQKILLKDHLLKILEYKLVEKDAKYQQELKEKDDQLEEEYEKINMLNQEINKKDKQLKEKEQIIADFQKIPKLPLDDNSKEELFEAIKRNNEEKVKLLLEIYKDAVNARDKYERTPFLYAARKGHLQIAKVLREGGAYLEAKDKWENNALHAACSDSGSVDMVTWLLDVCKLGIETKGNYEMKPFVCAAQKGQLEIAKLLKKKGANLNAKDVCGRNALHWACYYSGCVEMVTWLLDECKIDKETEGENQMTPFLYAANNGQLAIAKLLKEWDANLNAKDADGDNALHLACQFSGSVQMTTWLLDVCKIGLETKGRYERTPFLCAAQKGKLKVAKLLKERGANIRAKDKFGYNALDLAPK